jgi:hypothetical protein
MNALEAKDIITLVQAVAWPLTTIAGLLYFRAPLRKLVEELPGRASKIKIFDFSIELARLPQMSTTWTAGNADIRRLTAANMFDSNTHDLIQQISKSDTTDYAVIDLGDGRQWLTSRLFLIAELLDRMRSLNCLVFVQTREAGRPVFIGIAEAKAVRWSLARAYPMLETGLAHAYANQLPKPPIPPYQPVVYSTRGALELNQAANLLREFLQSMQLPAPPQVIEGWTELGNPPFWEYACWLDAQRLNGDLAEVLSTASFEDSPDLQNTQRVESILRRRGSYVALVDRNNFFEGLVDRRLLLEKAASALQPKAPVKNS